MDPYNLVAGFVFVGGGVYMFLAGTGRVEINPSDAVKSKEWRLKYGKFMTWGGPLVALGGVLHFLGIF
jgi:hypothetical protein